MSASGPERITRTVAGRRVTPPPTPPAYRGVADERFLAGIGVNRRLRQADGTLAQTGDPTLWDDESQEAPASGARS